MRQAARIITGRHDFRSFCTTDPARKKENTVRMVSRLDVKREGDFIRISIEADGFLYRMARNIAGVLIAAGKGRLGTAALKEILAAKDRTKAFESAPAHGLTLTSVKY